MMPEERLRFHQAYRGPVMVALVASHVLPGTLFISAFMALRLVRLRLSPATMPMGFAFTSLNSIALFIANLTGSVVPGLIFAMFFLLLVVMVRLYIRRVWVAGLVATMVLAFRSLPRRHTDRERGTCRAETPPRVQG